MRRSTIQRPRGFVRLFVIATLAIAAALLLPGGAARAGKGPVVIDERWVHPDFAARSPRRVAVLPAITQESFASSHLVSDLFYAEVANDGRAWMPPSLAHMRLGPTAHERDSTLRDLVVQVRRDGHPSPASTAAIARRLNVDALLVLRIDRWEHTSAPDEATNIEVRAELVDSTGTTLLRLVSRSRIFGERTRSEIEMPGSTVGTSGATPQATPATTSSATGSTSLVASSSIVPAGGGSGGTRSVTVRPEVSSGIDRAAPPVNTATMNATRFSEAEAPFEAATQALVQAWGPLLPAAPAPGRPAQTTAPPAR